MKTPSEKFKRPIVGKIKTKELKMIWIRDGKEEPASYPPEEYEVLGSTMMAFVKYILLTSGTKTIAASR